MAIAHAQTGSSLATLLNQLSAEPRNARLCEQIGVAYTRLQRFDEAAEFYRKAIQLDPHRITAEKNLATVLWFSGKRAESAKIFASLEKRIPQDPVPQLYLGLAAYENKHLGVAAGHFERAGSLASENLEVNSVLIETYLSTGHFENAIRILQAQIDAGDTRSEIYRLLGDAFNGLKSPDRASQAYSMAIEHEPDAEDNYLALAAFSVEHGNLPFARETLDRGLQRNPGSAKLLLESGLAWALDGDFKKARGFFVRANEIDAGWVLPLLAMGIADLQTGSADRARESFVRAKKIAPDDFRCYYLDATVLDRSDPDALDRAEMISDLRRAILLNPRQAKPRVALAKAQMSIDPSQAEMQLREALRIDPSDSTALYQLSLVCRRKGNTIEADRLSRAFQLSKTKAENSENELISILKIAK